MTFKSFRLIGAIFFLFLVGCASRAPKTAATPTRVQKAHWETKAQVRDLKNDKTHSLSIDVLGEKGVALRIEATAAMGVPVASYVMNQNGFRCLIPQKKTFYQGPLKGEGLKVTLNVPLAPEVLPAIAFDEPLGGPEWSCRNDRYGFIESCTDSSRKVSIHWSDRDGAAKKVSLKGPQFEMEWIFPRPRTEVQFRPQVFEIRPPAGYKIIQL